MPAGNFPDATCLNAGSVGITGTTPDAGLLHVALAEFQFLGAITFDEKKRNRQWQIPVQIHLFG